MKKQTLMFLATLMISVSGMAQTFTEKLTKELTFEKKSPANTLFVANITGSIDVVGYDGDKILIEAQKTIYAKTEERLEKGKKEVTIGVIDRVDTLIVFVEGLCNRFGKKQNCGNGSSGKHWGYNWCNCEQSCRETYDHKMNFTIKVPRAVNLVLETINEGDINTSGILGSVSANNINGSIKLKDLVREVHASTINGDVDIEYTKSPDKDCRFYTLNGNINANFPRGLAANLSFDSFNGEFFTNIDKVVSLPIAVEKTEGKEGIKFKVTGSRYKVGNGGALLDFETFNGNVYLKEKTN